MINKVKKRIVLLAKFQLESPLNVSPGLDEFTDSDVLRDAKGRPFVAGSSLAGAMRAYLQKEKNEDCLMGFSEKFGDKDIGKMSALFISDFIFDEETPKTNVRDGVALEPDKKVAKAGSKYDMEIIEAGACGYFFMELTVRENDDEEAMRKDLALVMKGLNEGEIRFGSKKTRGFGRVRVSKLSEKTFDSANWLEYADAYNVSTWESASDCLNDWLNLAADKDESQMIHIEVPLKMPGGISIRQYAAKKGEPDFVQLTDNGKPVIPGSSMAGALRSRIMQIANQLQANGQSLPAKTGAIIDTTFGYVDGTSAHASAIIIGETFIEGAKPLTMVRNGISRFESAAKSGALYKEKTYVNGTMTLSIMVRKTIDTPWIIGLLILAIKDLQQGLLAVGGQTAIGRGILLENGPITIDGEVDKEDAYIADLVKKMRDTLGKRQEGGNC